jgi:hypothetical protein
MFCFLNSGRNTPFGTVSSERFRDNKQPFERLPSNFALKVPDSLAARNKVDLKAERFYPRGVARQLTPKAGANERQ